ncbi:1,4-alpha-glucan branching protein domain-containing protein [Cerasicoccus fimbriatus]|uniref:1,4-alpha-glucan branching protein domain-containing protein n=1 Tax=Cerasicoccus fimbriatus TaxID=3014554 RepID=UPI0022B43015|nr:1,4-alpha-glucan branching protein domain-containing protein [Cerasicoccus sp. TK19100]
MSKPRTVSILLHAHLPYGLRPELPISMEECWLHETVLQCYLPLLELIGRLPKAKEPMLAVSLSPTLLELWAHHEFPDRFAAHLDRFQAILQAEQDNAKHPAERRKLAAAMSTDLDAARDTFYHTHQANLPRAWAQLAKAGKVELLTTAATHAFLPAHQSSPLSRRLQIEAGVDTLQRRTGVTPRGFWLPECAYYPGLENDLESASIEWFAVENMGQPIITECPNGVRALARNQALSRKVWDAQTGYPGHAAYREFHHDATHELSSEQAGLYRLPDGGNLPLGLKYWRVTGSGDKAWYDAAAAKAQAETDAADFLASLTKDATGLMFLPFDAELFGHWWHEGPHWLEQVLQNGAQIPQLNFSAPSAALADIEEAPVERPPASTWGRRSDYSFWINPETDWMYPLLKAADRALAELIETTPDDTLHQRALQQLARELLLAQASDWPFMIRAGATKQYAEERLRRHFGRFQYLAMQMRSDSIDEIKLAALEQLDPVFTTIDFERVLYFKA